jgi:citrate lyase beta subunit
VNSLPTGLTADDIAAVVTREVAGISVGKVNGKDDILQVSALLAKKERELGLPADSVGILPWIETAKAVMNAGAICTASPRVRWVAFGAEDFAADMGIARAVDSARAAETDLRYGEPGLIYARSAVTVAARAAGVWALDTPYVLFRDIEGLKADCALARRLGFRGKMAIHPAQLETINEGFAPSAEEVARAKKVLEAAAAAEREGRGSLSLDGEMVDAPVIARAKNVLRDAGLE